MTNTRTFKIVILGGGTAGISVAARLARAGLADQVSLIEPSSQHWYQPLWTLVAGGVFPMSDSVRRTEDFIPRGVTWIKNAATKVEAASRKIWLDNGDLVSFDWLIVATGLELHWDGITGARSALESADVCSIYSRDHVEKTRALLATKGSGTFLFTFPVPPVKCAGAPQKIMYLADEILRRRGLRERSRIVYRSSLPAIFGIPVFAEVLTKIIQRKGIETHFKQKCVEVIAAEKTAVFADVETNQEVAREKYDVLHLVPPMRPHGFIRASDLCPTEGAEAGWVDVDPRSLRHRRFDHVFALGDVCGAPNAKTGAAIRKQAPVVVANLLALMASRAMTGSYDGYASCPLVTGFGKVVLAEFGYDGKLMPSFPGNPARESRMMWWLKTRLLPVLYWRFMLRGRA